MERKKPNLILGNNVFAHVPDINDFIRGLRTLMASNGLVTLEFPHLLRLIEDNQFDTIYHEHYSYFSLYTVCALVSAHDLEVFDVEEISTHGGSLRVYVKHAADSSKKKSSAVDQVVHKEVHAGLTNLQTYREFHHKAESVKYAFLEFLLVAKKDGKRVAAYGAAAKGNTLLNYCGVKPDLLDFVVDASPHKQNRYLPGSHIPVVAEDFLRQKKPDYIVVLPWNLLGEIQIQLSYVREWGGKLVVAVPKLMILP